MKEKQLLETELQQYTDQILILEAKIEVFEEKMDTFREIIKEKKIEKNRLFSERDELIEEMRRLQKEKFETVMDSQKDRISENINKHSEKIGEVIENSKALSADIQAIYEESQVEYKNLIRSRDELKILQKESNQNVLVYKKKIADVENELTKLRNKMSEIQKKLSEDS
ncbi:MAG: hypothetical protein ACC656_07610 [Candidatus Heimdallarchaeota archaeon]